MLDRAISNLLSNALRYTPPGQTIALCIHQTADTTGLSIENPGGTIAPEHLAKLFDRFYRVDPARREGSPSNAGLGLAITRSIIEAPQRPHLVYFGRGPHRFSHRATPAPVSS